MWERHGERQRRTHWTWVDDIGAQPLGVGAFTSGCLRGDLQVRGAKASESVPFDQWETGALCSRYNLHFAEGTLKEKGVTECEWSCPFHTHLPMAHVTCLPRHPVSQGSFPQPPDGEGKHPVSTTRELCCRARRGTLRFLLQDCHLDFSESRICLTPV